LSNFIRQFHRWVSAAFVVCVIATTIALAQPEPVMWMSYVPLAPLALLALTGIYMFFLPYVRRHNGRGGQERAG
jgi:heme/copper-type cytochrome/quinol oxidase subunit 1